MNQAKKHHFNLDLGYIKHRQAKVVIFGAGGAGRQLDLGLGYCHECVFLVFVDDEVNLHGRVGIDV